jgi:type IV pilus assembly protein PilB
VNRLLVMGIAPFLVTASLNLIVAQRLCRRLCEDCKRPAAHVDEKALMEAGVPREKIGTFTLYENAAAWPCTR